MKDALSTWIALVDEIEFPIISGSLEFLPGKKKRDVEAMDNGDIVSTEDSTSAVGMIKFETKNTKSALANALIVESRKPVTVTIFTPDGAVNKVMRVGVSLNDSSRTSGTDAKIPLEFKGSPLET